VIARAIRFSVRCVFLGVLAAIALLCLGYFLVPTAIAVCVIAGVVVARG
jgi:hypothetical protein